MEYLGCPFSLNSFFETVRKQKENLDTKNSVSFAVLTRIVVVIVPKVELIFEAKTTLLAGENAPQQEKQAITKEKTKKIIFPGQKRSTNDGCLLILFMRRFFGDIFEDRGQCAIFS
jgi:hypothetical protein